MEDIVRLLGFEHEEEANDFLIHHGLLDPMEELSAIPFHTRSIISTLLLLLHSYHLTTLSFSHSLAESSEKLPAIVARNLIESKVEGMRVSEIINGLEGSFYTTPAINKEENVRFLFHRLC
jgi:hypothetical protein